jgi:hypothetical protein
MPERPKTTKQAAMNISTSDEEISPSVTFNQKRLV